MSNDTTTATADIQITRPKSMPEAAWRDSVDGLARAWMRAAGLNADLDLVSIDVTEDTVGPRQYPSLYEDRVPYLVQIAYRGSGDLGGFTIDGKWTIEPPPMQETVGEWDLLLLGLSLGLLGTGIAEAVAGLWLSAVLSFALAILGGIGVLVRRTPD